LLQQMSASTPALSVNRSKRACTHR